MNPTIAAINTQTLAFAPAVMAGMMAAEQTSDPGATKLQHVVNGVLGTSGALESNTNPNVAGIAAMVNLFATMWSASGFFLHKKAAPAK